MKPEAVSAVPWWLAITMPSPDCCLYNVQVIKEIEGGLAKWKESGRWEEKGILEQVANKDHTWAY